MKILMEVHPQFYSPKNNMREQLLRLMMCGYKFKYVINAKDYFKDVHKVCGEPVKTFRSSSRAIFNATNQEQILDWASTPCKGSKKPVRAFLMVKKGVL